MKNEKNQEFKSSGVLTLLGLVGFSATIIASPWNQSAQDSETKAALQKAEVVGYQVVQIYREATKVSAAPKVASGGRSPASISPKVDGIDSLRSTGTMGTDPWGQPYHYRVLPNAEKNSNIRIVVWSSGPNIKVESKDLENEDTKISGQPNFSGDDVGVVLSMSQN
ncbi:hypothetical protein [Bdellovibrio sp. KM01]|uniref:hypothetical protein n=1 Tax=Bdellovibrio sp. KM01 TaxID=2748865 RepID=UPI0015E92D03|nr:hypothetical protein [Bdellovibrio sp. KM01]QLY25662.1 hypothetical protein HW988_01010 [Bdellovibrio sp. KM01]